MQDVWDLIFAERYGVNTLVPSMHPVAAWMALWHHTVAAEIVKREPLALLRHGDPASLPMPIQTCKDEARQTFGVRYLALMMVADVNGCISDFQKWLAAGEVDKAGFGEWVFGALYERHDPIVAGMLDGASVATLERLLDLAYKYVKPQRDVVHDGVFSPGSRDAAECGRNAVLSDLLERSGADAYRALQRLTTSPNIRIRAHRFRELTRGKAEKDTEFPAWNEEEVLRFQEKYTAPVKMGHDLLVVISNVIGEIQHSLLRGDLASSVPLLQRAQDEEEVKRWLVEQMEFRSKGRFRAYRESEIAFGDMPDMIVASTSAPVEVGMEVKHGGKNWTLKQYESSLRSQLAQDYLKPSNRRHGIFIVSYHGNRTWRDSSNGTIVDFKGLMTRLAQIAEALVSNEDGAIEVRAFGIDAAPIRHVQPHRRLQRIKSPRHGNPGKRH
jgi:hypothetical protein